MGDSSVLRVLRELASSPRPLVRLEPGDSFTGRWGIAALPGRRA